MTSLDENLAVIFVSTAPKLFPSREGTMTSGLEDTPCGAVVDRAARVSKCGTATQVVRTEHANYFGIDQDDHTQQKEVFFGGAYL